MNDNPEIPNKALRAHVTDHSFVLTLRKTHIAVLAEIAHGIRPERRPGFVDHFIPAVHGVIRRGLLEHRHRPNFIGKTEGKVSEPITNYYRLTRAGWAVFDLMVEAGLAEAIDNKSAKRRLVA